VGLRAINKSGAKRITRGLRAASKSILRTACARWQATVSRGSQFIWQQQRRKTASLVRRLRSICARKLWRRRTAARRPRWRTRWPTQWAADALSFFVHSTAHMELQGIYRRGCCMVCAWAAQRGVSGHLGSIQLLCAGYIVSNTGPMHTWSQASPILVRPGQSCRTWILVHRVPRVRHTSNVMRVD
jgi:hypothetical protein